MPERCQDCGFFIYENQQMKQAESMACLDTWSDEVVTSVDDVSGPSKNWMN